MSKKREHCGWAAVDPDGKVIASTMRKTRRRCIDAVDVMFWPKYDDWSAMRREGWRIVKVVVVRAP